MNKLFMLTRNGKSKKDEEMLYVVVKAGATTDDKVGRGMVARKINKKNEKKRGKKN